jgi:hypothetical protein
MNKLYPIIIMLSITTLTYGASAYPEPSKKSDKCAQIKQPLPSSTTHPTSASKLPITQMAAATLSIGRQETDIHPTTYVPGMPGLQFSDHSPYNHHDHTLYG